MQHIQTALRQRVDEPEFVTVYALLAQQWPTYAQYQVIAFGSSIKEDSGTWFTAPADHVYVVVAGGIEQCILLVKYK